MRFQRGVCAADAERSEINAQRRGGRREATARVAQTNLTDEVRPEHDGVAQDRRQPVVGARAELAIGSGIRKRGADRRRAVFTVALTEGAKEPVAAGRM